MQPSSSATPAVWYRICVTWSLKALPARPALLLQAQRCTQQLLHPYPYLSALSCPRSLAALHCFTIAVTLAFHIGIHHLKINSSLQYSLAGPILTAPYLTDEHDHTTACLQAAGAAETAIELCVLSRRADVLWGEVYPRYLACGQHPALLERLLPHILASKLLSLPPEVMQVGCNCLHATCLSHNAKEMEGGRISVTEFQVNGRMQLNHSHQQLQNLVVIAV